MDFDKARQLRAALMQIIAGKLSSGDRRAAEDMRPLAMNQYENWATEDIESTVPDFRSLIGQQSQAEDLTNSGVMISDLAKLLRR